MPTTMTPPTVRLTPFVGVHEGYIYVARTDGFDIHDMRDKLVKVEHGAPCDINTNIQRAKLWITSQINSNLLARCWLD